MSQQVTQDADLARLRELADALDALTEHDLRLLCHVEESTPRAWRKRGEGPSYFRLGNAFLYPKPAVRAWAASRIRERATPSGKDAL